MMKRKTIQRLIAKMAMLVILLVGLSARALAYDAQTAQNWMEQFAGALSSLSPVNDPANTADPARAGQYLLEYTFGTVLSRVNAGPQAGDILEIDIRTNQVTDCRGVRVGMHLEQALDGKVLAYGASPLYVLYTQAEGLLGWNWAYVGEQGVYGVEYVSYGDNDASMKEYTLTYIIEHDTIAAIRMKVADVTLAQAQDGLKMAEELAARQTTGVLIQANDRPVLAFEDLQVMGRRALGVPVDQLIAVMGEPDDIQTLPESTGRVLIYKGAVVTLGFNEMTGEEIVRAVSVSSSDYEGPNRLAVGMTLQEVGSLVRCDTDVYSRGGILYLEGEALGEAPYGELKAVSAREMMLTYACAAPADAAVLQAIAVDEQIVSWQLMYLSDMQGGI